jgi:hypothetical protein
LVEALQKGHLGDGEHRRLFLIIHFYYNRS